MAGPASGGVPASPKPATPPPAARGSPHASVDGDGGDGEPPPEPSVDPNPGATAAGARTRIDEAGVLPYHTAVYGPYRPVEAAVRERADTRLVDVSLALNSWMPPAAAPQASGDRARPTDEEARAARREAAEAERLAAAADARSFFEEQAVKRAQELTMDGLALHEAVRAARCRPWDVWTRRELTNAGIDAVAAERAVRKWEPQLFDDPIMTRHVAGCWHAEMEYRERGLHTLAKEGWLWMPGIGRKWVMLRKNKGLLWSQAPNGFILGMILFPFLDSFMKARDDECAIEFTRNRVGVVGSKVRLRAETPEEAHDWFLHIGAEFDLFKVNNGIGHLQGVQVLKPSKELVIKLPAVDLNEDVKERAVVFHVQENQEFQEGDLLLEVERANDIQPVVEVFARFPGRVLKVAKSRKENKTDSKYAYFAVGDPVLHVLRDPDWVDGECFLPRAEPTDVEKECVAARRVGMEVVAQETQDESRPSSRVSGRLASQRLRFSARLSSGQAVQAKDVMSILVAASYDEHPDEFWMRNKLILDSMETANAPAHRASDSASYSRAPSRGQDLDVLLGTVGTRVGGTALGRQTRQGTMSRTGSPFGVRGASLRKSTGAAASRSVQADGDAQLRDIHDRYHFSTQTVSSRYSASAIAAASKILLQT
jgi:hypothetical protein